MEKHEKGSKKHITSDQRFKILKYLSLGYNIPKIAKLLGYNKTSIYREIVINSVVEYKISLNFIEKGFKKCKNIQTCRQKGIVKCPECCMHYIPMCCCLIKKPYDVCNFCEKKNGCKYERRIYHPEIAQDSAKERFKAKKTSLKLNDDELKQLDSYISPLVINGQSPEVVKSYSSNKDFPVCSKTLRNYIDKGVLTVRNINLKRKLSIRPSNQYKYPRNYSHNPLKKIDHLYDDYLNYMANHPDLITFQCDTVFGKRGDRKCLLTIHADKMHFQMYFLVSNKTPLKVNRVFMDLKEKIGEEKYSKVFRVILSDNGAEFDSLTDIEIDENGVIISKVFYTRAYRSSDKAECERNHELFRYIRVKGKTLDTIDEEDIYLVNAHINSYPRKSLKWKTPIEVMKEQYGDDIIDLLGIKELKRKDVMLTAKLLSHK